MPITNEKLTGSETKASALSRITAFALGLFGVVAIYAVFYLRNHNMVFEFWDDYGTAGIILAAIALLVIAAVGGTLSVLTKPHTGLSALTTGLSVPGMLFAMELMPSGPADQVTDVQVQAPAAMQVVDRGSPVGAMLASRAGSRTAQRGTWWDYIQPIISPTSAAVRYESRGVYRRAVQQHQVSIADMTADLRTARVQLENEREERERLALVNREISERLTELQDEIDRVTEQRDAYREAMLSIQKVLLDATRHDNPIVQMTAIVFLSHFDPMPDDVKQRLEEVRRDRTVPEAVRELAERALDAPIPLDLFAAPRQEMHMR